MDTDFEHSIRGVKNKLNLFIVGVMGILIFITMINIFPDTKMNIILARTVVATLLSFVYVLLLNLSYFLFKNGFTSIWKLLAGVLLIINSILAAMIIVTV